MTLPAPPIRVHRVIGRLNVGGPALHVVNLSQGLDSGSPLLRGISFQNKLLAGAVEADEADMGYYAKGKGVPVESVGPMSRSLGLWRDLRSLVELYRVFRRDRPQIVHTHTAKAGTVGRLAAWLAGVPVRIHTFHGHVLGGGYFSPHKTRLFLEIERQLARLTSRIIVLSEQQRKEMVEGLGVATEDRFAVIPLGLELDRFARVLEPSIREDARRRIRVEFELAPEAPLVAIVGRLVPVKNHELMLRALAELGQLGREDAVLLVVGGGDERELSLRSLAESLGLGGRVKWLGWRRDLPDLYAAVDVVGLTSLDEGTPVALIESLAAGTPVVSRAVGGVPEVLEGGLRGRLVQSDSPFDFAQALGASLAAPPDEVSRAETSRWALDTFSVARLVADVSDLYLREMRLAGLDPFRPVVDKPMDGDR